MLVLLIVLWGGLLFAYRCPLRVCWREPALTQPVFILESDDWGAGPLFQASALERLRLLLLRHHDASGHPAVMTLGLVLEVADTQAMAVEVRTYVGRDLHASEYAALRAAIEAGEQGGVFALQLHGQCHYWPASLMAAAADQPAVAAWLTGPANPRTEDLPSPLQSRWTDASELPSRDLTAAAVSAAVAAEAQLYRALFERIPRVAVPMTFVWTDAVETAWAQAGVRCVVTPGRRLTRREADATPGGADKVISNGERTHGGMVYVVRDVYFEPALGHTPQQLVDGLRRKWNAHRPCLVEMHRFNFLDEGKLEDRLQALEAAMEQALVALPDLRFLSTENLAAAFADNDPAWVARDFPTRMKAWLARIRELPRFRKLCVLSGLALPFTLLERVL